MVETFSIAPLATPFNFPAETEPKFIIILVHGFTASPTEVRPLGEYIFNYFDQQASVTSILLPGHGRLGDDGFKALDTVSYMDWIKYFHEKINTIVSENKDIPILLGGLSMGTLLICEYLGSKDYEEQITGAILLSPPFFIRSKLFNWVRVLKYIIKYQTKEEKMIKFFQNHNLFSYHQRSVKSVHEFKKLIGFSKKKLRAIDTPATVYLAEKDDVVDVVKVQKLLTKLDFITHAEIIPDKEHIFTVDPNIKHKFNDICEWITKLIENYQTN